MDNRITEVWEQLCDFIVFRNSLDLGGLNKLMDLFVQGIFQDGKSFAQQIIAFLGMVSSQAKIRPHGQADSLSILAMDTFINNIYSYCRNGQQFQPNSSSFYGWMSSSQMSMDQSNTSERQGQATLVLELVKTLGKSQAFFKILKTFLEKSRNQQKTKRYVEHILETIDHILSKDHISKENFLKYKGKYVGLESRKKYQINYGKVNQVIFSSQLNKVVAVLAGGPDNVHLSLLRIYLSWKEDSKIYEGVKFSGQEMLINLYRYYISSFKDLDELFEEGKHPIFRFLRNHFALYYTPTLRQFHQLVAKISAKTGDNENYQFFKICQQFFKEEIVNFINDVPFELVRLLSQLKDLVQEQHHNHIEIALSSVKKLFFYSFLLDQSLMEQLYPRHDPTKYATVYNHILHLFFTSSLKKYTHLPQSQQTLICRLVQDVASIFDSRITNQLSKLDIEENFFEVRQNIINYDYDIVMQVLAKLEFTPKDSKQFQMKKICNIAPQSPIYKHFKTQAFVSEQRQQQLELATWMSVGGSRDWSQTRYSKPSKPSLSQRLGKLKTIDPAIRSRLSSESQQFLLYLPH